MEHQKTCMNVRDIKPGDWLELFNFATAQVKSIVPTASGNWLYDVELMDGRRWAVRESLVAKNVTAGHEKPRLIQ